MNVRISLFVILGGALGTFIRFYLSGFLPVYNDFPIGTLLVNSLASFMLGYLYGLLFWGVEVPPELRAFFGIGLCGSLSTFSTFSFETFNLIREKEHFLALLNVSINVIITVLLVFLGFILARR